MKVEIAKQIILNNYKGENFRFHIHLMIRIKHRSLKMWEI